MLVDGAGGYLPSRDQPPVTKSSDASNQYSVMWDSELNRTNKELWWKEEDPSFIMSSPRRNHEPIQFALCKSYDKNSPDNDMLLLRSHPYSPFYSDFITLKVIVLLVALLFSVMLACFKYPDEISTYYFPTEARNHNIYSMLSFLMMITRLGWISILIGVQLLSVFLRLCWLKVVSRGAKRLAAARYMTSRYLQMSFRVLTEQVTC